MGNDTLDCPVREQINEYCSCPKTTCENHGLCCRCIVKHKNLVDKPFDKRLPHCLRGILDEALAAKKL